MTEVARLGEALGDRQPGTGMAAVEDIMRRLRAAREAPHAIELAERPEALESAGQQLVRVGLVAGVLDDPVPRRLEQAVKRDRQLDHAERRTEVPARARHRAHAGVPDLD